MNENYTRQTIDRYLDLPDQSLYRIWDDIENTPEDTSADKWRRKILGIAHEYNLSSRFVLMRILYCRCSGLKDLSACSPDEGVSFTMKIGNETVEFSDVSIQHALQLTDAELKQYEDALMETAAAQRYPDYNEKTAQRLISKGIRTGNDLVKKTLLSRKDAFALGHVLGFSALEMNWFLLRVFQTGNAFMFKSSDDLIEYYCFESKKNYTSALKLKEEYVGRTVDIEMEEEDAHPLVSTQLLEETFVERVDGWKTMGDQGDELFMQWLVEHARYLNRPSRTGLRIYRNLALYAFHIAIGQESVPDERKILARLKDEIDRKDNGELHDLLQSEGERLKMLCDKVSNESILMDLFEDIVIHLPPDKLSDAINNQPKLKMLFKESANALTPETLCKAIKDRSKLKELFKEIANDLTPEILCEMVAKVLTLENSLLTYTNVTDKYKAAAWGVLSVNSKKNPSRSQGNIMKVLLGKESLQKNDMLYLVWFLLNRSWTEHVSSKAIPGDREDILSRGRIFNRMADFTDISDYVLKKALLPAFYPPHLMEQSMMLAIVTSTNNAKRIPAQTYEEICRALIEPQKKSKPEEAPKEPDAPAKLIVSHKAAPLTKAEREKKMFGMIEDYLQNNLTLKACADKYGTSIQTVVNWKQKYLEKHGK